MRNLLRRLDRALFHDVHNRELARQFTELNREWDAWFAWADGELAELRKRD